MNFSNAENIDRLTEMLNKNRLYGTLKSSDFDAVDNISPLLSALADAFVGMSRTAEVRSSKAEYVVRIDFAFRKHMNFEWIEKTIQLLEQSIRSFKKNQDFYPECTKHHGCLRRSGMRFITYLKLVRRLDI